MIEHARTRSRLGAYVDGELTGEARERVERHLGRCAACAESAGRMAAIAAGLRASQPLVQPLADEQADRVLERVLAARTRRGRPATTLAAASLAAAVIVLVAIWVSLGGRRGTGGPLGNIQALRTASRPTPSRDQRGTQPHHSPKVALRQRPGAAVHVALGPQERRTEATRDESPRRGPRMGTRPGGPAVERRPGMPSLMAGPGAYYGGPGGAPAQAVPDPGIGQALAVATTGQIQERPRSMVQMTMTRAPLDAPGYARAASLRPDERGAVVLHESAVSSDGARRTALTNTVTLGRQGEEQAVLRVAAQAGEQTERQGVIP